MQRTARGIDGASSQPHEYVLCALCAVLCAVRFAALLLPILESLVSLSHHDAFSVDFWNFLGDLRFGNEAKHAISKHMPELKGCAEEIWGRIALSVNLKKRDRVEVKNQRESEFAR